jgi:hypothetical protein
VQELGHAIYDLLPQPVLRGLLDSSSSGYLPPMPIEAEQLSITKTMMMRDFTALGEEPARRAAEARIPQIEFLIIENLLPLYTVLHYSLGGSYYYSLVGFCSELCCKSWLIPRKRLVEKSRAHGPLSVQ